MEENVANWIPREHRARVPMDEQFLTNPVAKGEALRTSCAVMNRSYGPAVFFC